METLFSWLDQTINKSPVAALTILVAISIFLFGYLLVRLQEQIRSLGDYVDDRESALNQKYKSLGASIVTLTNVYQSLSSRIEDPAFKGDLAIARELVTLVNSFMENCNTHFCRLDHHVDSLEGSLNNRLDEVESALETLEDTLKYGTASDTDAVKDELLDCIQAKEETAPAVSNMEGFSQPGKPSQTSKWVPQVGDWVKIKKPESWMHTAWMSMMDEHDGEVVQVAEIEGDAIIHHCWAFEFGWLEPAEQPKPTTEVAVEVTSEVKNPLGCPDGWRFLDVGEVVRKGDVWLENGQIHSLGLLMIGQTCQTHWKPIIRRNRFEVGERVFLSKSDDPNFFRVAKHISDELVLVYCDGIPFQFFSDQLAPYIEVTGEVTGEVKPDWMPAVGERVRFKGQSAARPDWIVDHLLEYPYVLLKRSTDGVPSGGYVSQLEPAPKPEQETEAPKPRFSRGEVVRIVCPKGLLPGETYKDPISKSTFYAGYYEAYLGKDGQIVGPSSSSINGLWEVMVYIRGHHETIRLPETMLHKVLS